MKQIKIDRSALYGEVWTTPMTKLAQKYNLSDVGLAKICRAMNIPIPYRGYWAKKAAGKSTPKTPLSKATEKTLSEYRINVHEISSDVKLTISENMGDTDFTVLKELKLIAPLEEYHPLIEATRRIILSRKDNPLNPMVEPGTNTLDITCSKANLDRASRIMQTIMDTIECIGGRIEIGEKKYNSNSKNTYVILHDEKINISLKEVTGYVKHIPTEEELKRQKRNPWDKPPEFEPAPSNRFVLEIGTYTRRSRQRKWADSPTKSLDDQIGRFIIGLIKTAPVVKQERLESEEQERKRKEAEEQAKQEQERREEELRKIKVLNAHLSLLDKINRIDDYLSRLEKSLELLPVSEDRHIEINHWIEWVKKYRSEIDIFNPDNFLFEKNVPSELDDPAPKPSYFYYSHQEEQREKENRFGWWNRPPWKW